MNKPTHGISDTPRQTKHCGRERVGRDFDLAANAYNLIRLPGRANRGIVG